MLPEHMREALWRKVSLYLDADDADVKRAVLWLQDAGHADEEIINLIRPIWNVAQEIGYDEGYESALNDNR